MKRLNEKTYAYLQPFIIVLVILFLATAFSNHTIFFYSIYFLFKVVGSFVVGFFIYIFISSLLITIFQYRRHKKWNEPFLSEKSMRPFYALILFIFSLTALYMAVSTIFSLDTFSFRDLLHISMIIGVAILIIYIPSLFIPWMEESNIISFLYLVVFYMIMHIMLFAPIYILMFVQV